MYLGYRPPTSQLVATEPEAQNWTVGYSDGKVAAGFLFWHWCKQLKLSPSSSYPPVA